MITFLACVTLLIAGYFVYGTYVDKNTKLSDDNVTPAIRLEDGVADDSECEYDTDQDLPHRNFFTHNIPYAGQDRQVLLSLKL